MQINQEHVVRPDPAEAWNAPRPVAGLDLFPCAIVALGCPTAPAERLMGLQSGVAKLIELLTTFRPWRPGLLSRLHAIRPLAHR